MKRKPVSLADLARELDTSPATVSRALKNHPRISAGMKRRAREAADRLGYRSDPETARLMAHIRRSGITPYQSTLGMLLDRDKVGERQKDPYTREVIAGAAERAEALGYRLDPIHLREPGMTQRRLEDILQARSIHGVLIPPQEDLPNDIVLPEENVALVAATAARAHHNLHRVTPDHFHNLNLLMDALIGRGYRRIGLVTSTDMEERQRHTPDAVYEWRCRQTPCLKRIPPLTLGSARISLRDWAVRHRPDALLCIDNWVAEELGWTPGHPHTPGVCLFGNTREGYAGIDEQPRVIGSAAVDLLTAQILRQETGRPEHPKTVLIRGTFIDGPSLTHRNG